MTDKNRNYCMETALDLRLLFLGLTFRPRDWTRHGNLDSGKPRRKKSAQIDRQVGKASDKKSTHSAFAIRRTNGIVDHLGC